MNERYLFEKLAEKIKNNPAETLFNLYCLIRDFSFQELTESYQTLPADEQKNFDYLAYTEALPDLIPIIRDLKTYEIIPVALADNIELSFFARLRTFGRDEEYRTIQNVIDESFSAHKLL